jgi:thiol-disulfide isomerase/thioredoxin
MFKYLLCFYLIVPISGFSQHQITGSFSPPSKFKSTMLYHLSAGDATYTSYGTVDEQGAMQIDLDAAAPTGMYRVVYALPQSEHNFEFIYNGKEDVVFNFDATRGIKFISSKENQLLHSYKGSIATAQNELMKLYAQPPVDSINYIDHVQKIDSLQNAYETLSKGTIAAHFIAASKPYIPSKLEPAETYVAHAKAHFFKAVNFQNKTLQSSNFIIDKCIDYIFEMHTSQTPSFQDFTSNIDTVYQSFLETELLYQLTSLNILNEILIDLKQEALAVYLTQTYVLPLASQLNAIELIVSMESFLRVAVGAKAPNFEIKNPKNELKISLYDLKGNSNYILIFWSSDCGHCMNELPEIHAYISKHPEKDIKVIAIGLENNLQPWDQAIQLWPKFTHAIAEGKWENNIPIHYDITATPSYFVLDASKTITSKPYLLKDLKAVLDQK